jgi:hypothetical protein
MTDNRCTINRMFRSTGEMMEGNTSYESEKGKEERIFCVIFDGSYINYIVFPKHCQKH